MSGESKIVGDTSKPIRNVPCSCKDGTRRACDIARIPIYTEWTVNASTVTERDAAGRLCSMGLTGHR